MMPATFRNIPTQILRGFGLSATRNVVQLALNRQERWDRDVLRSDPNGLAFKHHIPQPQWQQMLLENLFNGL